VSDLANPYQAPSSFAYKLDETMNFGIKPVKIILSQTVPIYRSTHICT